MNIKRGDLFYAALEENNVGSEQTGIRPIVVLQNNIGNEHSPTIIVAPITSRVGSKTIIPTHVWIKGYKNRLRYYIGRIDDGEMRLVDKALVISLGLNLNKIKKETLHRDGIEEKTEFVTRRQIASYGVVAKENLKNSGNLEITNKLFGEYILTLLDLYSPDEIEKIYEKCI